MAYQAQGGSGYTGDGYGGANVGIHQTKQGAGLNSMEIRFKFLQILLYSVLNYKQSILFSRTDGLWKVLGENFIVKIYHQHLENL